MRWALLLSLCASFANAQSSFDRLVDQYFDAQFALNPTTATAAGFHHPYDAQLEDYSAAANQKRIAVNQHFLKAFKQMPASDDRALVLARIHADLLALQSIQQQEKNPDFYSSGITGSIFTLISRQFAPPEQRLQDVIAREEKIPAVFDNARQNLSNPPKIYTTVALQQLPGIESFFQTDVPAAFTRVKDQALRAEFKATNTNVLQSLRSYQQWLQTTLLPRSNGDFRIGADNFHKKLMYEEMMDLPLDQLLHIGYENLRANQKALQELSTRIDKTKTPQQIADRFENDHPAPDQLLGDFRSTFNGLIDFINSHHIITIPSQVRPIVEETPPFLRALTTASMDPPGPYEKVATEAYFNVTLPEKNWSPKETQEFMTAFNRGTITSTAIHEAYPGHYVQLLWFQKVPSKVRKLLLSNSNVEGWAHYSEQMMLDQGYGNGDPELRFGQLLDALLRNCRYIVGIQMHTGQMTYEQGIAFFMKEGFMSHAYAERETKRGTSDPTYLVYTLGKLEIVKLREDYRQKVGESFSLGQFHNQFVGFGGIPVKIIRKEMLGNGSPVL